MLTNSALAITAVAALFGLMVGSFLNVVVIRVPEGRSVVRPRSACGSCGEPIRERDNIPVLSWLLLRGRARCCGAPFSARYPLVEAGTAVAFGVVAAWTGVSWRLPALLYLVAISIALALIDLATHRLPNLIVLPAYPVAGVLLTVAALAEHEPRRLIGAAVGGLVLYVFYFVLMLAYEILLHTTGMGFGDVKLAGVLGLYLGFFGWQFTVVGAFLAFLIGGVVGLALMAVGRVGRKSQLPFGPYMLAGTWIGLAIAAPVTSWYLATAGIA